MPAIGRPRGEPGERDECSGHAGAHDGRLRTDREHVPGDRRERTELAEPPWQAEQPRQGERAAGHQHDVLPGDGEQVVEPGRSEPLPEAVGERLLVPEDDALDNPAALAVQTRCDRSGQPAAESVGDAAKPTAPSDEPPAFCPQHDVDPVVT